MQTMSRRSVRSVALLAVAAALIGLLGLLMCTGSAYASPRLTTAKSPQVVVYNPNYMPEGNWQFILPPKGIEDFTAEIYDLKSTNEKVIYPEVYDDDTILLNVYKPGKATISCTYHGEEYSINYIVKKYVNPVKSFKIGKKEYAKKFKKRELCNLSVKTLKGKLKIVPAKNWKIKKINLNYIKSGNMLTKKVKNGQKIKGVEVWVTLKNKKTKAVERLILAGEEDLD